VSDDKTLSTLIAWIEGRKTAKMESDPHRPISMTDEPETPGSEGKDSSPLSQIGKARWLFLRALSDFYFMPKSRYSMWTSWEKKDLRGEFITVDDRYSMAAWLIFGLNPSESYEAERMAKWLRRLGIKDPSRLARWAEEIEDLDDISGDDKLFRSGMVAELRSELFRLLKDEKDAKEPKPTRPGQG
jgi:hypothetical protein